MALGWPREWPRNWCTGESDYAETMRQVSRFIVVLACLSPAIPATAVPLTNSSAVPPPTTARIDHVADGDTFTLRNGKRVRIIGIWLDGSPITALTTRAPLGTRPITTIGLGDTASGRRWNVTYDDLAAASSFLGQ